MNKNLKNKQVKEKINILLEDHNWSWIREIYERNQNDLDSIALDYKGKKVTYRELLFKTRLEYASALKYYGINEGMEVPICMSNIPEFIYLIAGISTIGAKFNSFSNEFNPEYIKEIINKCDSDILFVSSDMYPKLKDIIANTHIQKIVFVSVDDSLNKEDNDINRKVRLLDKKVIGLNTFLSVPTLKKDYQPLSMFYFEQVNWYKDFSVTYLDNDDNLPFAFVLDNLSYIAKNNFKVEFGNSAQTKKRRVLAHMPNYLNSSFMEVISNSLMNGDTIVLEPNYNIDNFMTSIIQNKPNVVYAPKSFWLQFAKEIMAFDRINEPFSYSKEIRDTFRTLEAPVSTDLLLKNEEDFINQALRKASGGLRNNTNLFIPKISVSFGSCFYKQAKLAANPGFDCLDCVEIDVVDEDGNKLKKGKIGRLVVNDRSCEAGYFKEYENAKVNFDDLYVYNDNEHWLDLNVYGYIDKFDKVQIKGDVVKGSYPPFIITDVITRKNKEILSCEVTPLTIDNQIYYVANVEFNPSVLTKKNDYYNLELNCLIYSMERRLRKILPKEISERVLFRFISNDFKMPLTTTGKIDNKKLTNMGLNDTIKVFSPTDCDIEKLNLKYLMNTEYFAFSICDGKSYIESRKNLKRENLKQKIKSKNN